MAGIKLLSKASCEDLLDFQNNSAIRESYFSSGFSFSKESFLEEPLTINEEVCALQLGVNPSDDLESSIKIFQALRSLDLVQANDKRLWVTLTHTIFFPYVKARWNINENSSVDVIKDRFHYEGVGLRPRNQNGVARFWWAARITFDEKRPDPFELTRLLWEKQDLYQNLIDRKLSIYEDTLKAFLEFYSKNRHLDMKRDMRRLIKGINAYGGVRVLPLLKKDQVLDQIHKLCQFYKIEAA